MNIHSNDKQYIVEYIYSHIQLSKYSFRIMNTEEDLNELKNANYQIMPNFRGFHSFLVFLKIKEKYFSVVLERPHVNKGKMNIEKLNINFFDVKVPKDLYKGTVMEGTSINGKKFVVNGIFYWAGNSVENKKISDNFKLLEVFEKEKKVIPNYVYSLPDIVQLYVDYDMLRETSDVMGMSFYPETLGKKLVFLFSGEKFDNIKTLDYFTRKEPKAIGGKKVTATFEVIKDDETSDIYYLRLVRLFKDNAGNRKIGYVSDQPVSSDFFPIASIRDIEHSKEIRGYFENRDSLVMDCELLPKKYDKLKWNSVNWVPQKVSAQPFPDFVGDVDKQLETIY